ncbi:23756_t:CDS:1, partial [Dentiscutata erythropus]
NRDFCSDTDSSFSSIVNCQENLTDWSIKPISQEKQTRINK